LGGKPILTRLNLVPASVVERRSRVTLVAEVEGQRLLCHLRNTGRLLDYIYPGAKVLVTPKLHGQTQATVIGATVGEDAAIIDPYTQARCFEWGVERGAVSWLRPFRLGRREVFLAGSRIDYLLTGNRGSRGFLELKSAVFLDSDRFAMYPDCRSERGRRHVRLFMKMATKGRMVIVFVAAHPWAVGFKPSVEGDPVLTELLRSAHARGVELRAVKMHIDAAGRVVWDDDDLPIIFPHTDRR